MIFRSVLVIVVIAAPLAVGACYRPDAPPPATASAIPYPPVPAPRPEERPLPPVSEDQLVWRMGQWEWVGTGYVWRGGEWEKLGDHTNQYMPGHWTPQGGAWVWERGHWL